MRARTTRGRALPRTAAAALAAGAAVVATTAGAANGLAANPHSGAAATACTVSGQAAPSWLSIRAVGLTPGGLYQAAVATPVGTTLGNSLYADSNGSFLDTSLPSPYSGTYLVTVTKFNGNSVVASCSTTIS